MDLTPRAPSAGPTGGLGDAFPAPIKIRLTNACERTGRVGKERDGRRDGLDLWTWYVLSWSWSATRPNKNQCSGAPHIVADLVLVLMFSITSATYYIVEQVILEECDDALSKRSNVPIGKDGVYHLPCLLETLLDHRPLWAELSSYLLPVVTKKDPTLLFRKSHSSTCPSSLAFAKWTR